MDFATPTEWAKLPALVRLADIGTVSLGKSLSQVEASALCTELGIAPLTELYALRNGMFALEYALHIFPLTETYSGYTLPEWNDLTSWRRRYPDIEHLTFFAENIFGNRLDWTGKPSFASTRKPARSKNPQQT